MILLKRESCPINTSIIQQQGVLKSKMLLIKDEPHGREEWIKSLCSRTMDEVVILASYFRSRAFRRQCLFFFSSPYFPGFLHYRVQCSEPPLFNILYSFYSVVGFFSARSRPGTELSFAILLRPRIRRTAQITSDATITLLRIRCNAIRANLILITVLLNQTGKYRLLHYPSSFIIWHELSFKESIPH